MAQIAKAMKTSRATLYRYFPDRDTLIRELALNALRLTDEAATRIVNAATYRDAFELLVQETLAFGDQYHFLMNEPRVLGDPEIREGVERQSRELTEMIDAAKAYGEIDRSVPTAWIAASYEALMWAAWSSVHKGSIAPLDAPALVMRSLWPGIAA